LQKICAVEKKRRDHDARQDANKDESNNKKRKPAESEKANVPVDLDPAEVKLELYACSSFKKLLIINI